MSDYKVFNMNAKPSRPEKYIVRGGENYQVQPVKYNTAWKNYLQMLQNFWTPGEINMSQDKQCYEYGLNDTERHLFTKVFMTLSAMDAYAVGGVIDKIKGFITSPEHQQVLAMQIGQEAIHTHTYAHCITMLGLDPEYIWNAWKDIPSINNKIEYSKKQVGRLSTIKSLDHDDDLREFLTAYLFFAGIFEGVWFYNGFSPIFALQQSSYEGIPKMYAAAEQLQYILRDEALHFGFGLDTINSIIRETGVRPDEDVVRQMCNEAIALEEAYIRDAFSNSALMAYSPDQHIEACRYFMNRRMLRGMDMNVYPECKEDPIPWLSSLVSTRKEKNFFETRVTEYQVGASLDWGDQDDVPNIKNPRYIERVFAK
jgi:ribonucleoside-diphosphate reductase beta chain